MKKYILLRNMVVSLFIAGAFTSMNAQLLNTPASLELMKESQVWRNSGNAAGLILDAPVKYGEFNINYTTYTGDFHRPQQANNGNNLDFFTEGATWLNKIYVWGQFDYSRDNQKGVNFKQSIIDPYRGMPYYITDLNESNWENQFYNMRFKVNFPISKKIFLGLDGSYNVAQGAKQRDIRTTNLSYALRVKPAIVYTPTKSHYLGIGMEYSNFKEEANPDMVNASDYQKYYELYGLGTAVENIGSGKTVNYMGNNVGGNVQYAYYHNRLKILAEGYFLFQVEDAEFSFTQPQKFGTVRKNSWGSNLFVQYKGEDFSHYLDMSYAGSKADGIQYIKQNTSSDGWQVLHSNVRSVYKADEVALKYSLIANRGDEYKWRLGAQVRYQDNEDEYILPHSVKQAENLLFSVNGKVNLALSEALEQRLLIGLTAGYNKNLSGEYQYNGNNTDYSVVTDFEQNDLNYQITDFYHLSGSVGYSQRVSEKSKTAVHIEGSFHYQHTKDFDFGNRSLFRLSLGCNF